MTSIAEAQRFVSSLPVTAALSATTRADLVAAALQIDSLPVIRCPKCPADFPARYAGYAARHAEIHARQERDSAESARADALVTAARGPVKPARAA